MIGQAVSVIGSAALVAALALADHVAQPPACASSPDDLVWVSGGKTVIGSDRAYPEEGPAHHVTVPGFWIDRHEVSNRQFTRFVSETGYVTLAERPDGPGGSIVFTPPDTPVPTGDPRAWWRFVKGADWRHPAGPGSGIAGREDHPVVNVAYADALAYARWAGRSLPSEEQFEYAARAGAAESLDQPAPDAANSWQGEFPNSNDRTDGHAGLAPVGCFKRNAYGLNDMLGNAWEWTGSWYLPSHGPVLIGEGAPGNPSFDPNLPGAKARVIKGGSFLCAPNYCARYRPSARHAQDELSGASHLGFRTVLNAKRG